MKKTTMTNRTLNAKVVRAGAILSALLMVLLPSTGFGNFASAANAVTNDQDTSLSTFTVDGTAVSNGSSVNVSYGTSAVDVVATPNNADATVDVSGDTGLQAGDNTLTVLVTAADDVTTETYSVTVNVGKNNDTSLGVFTVNGDDVANGGTVNLSYGTTEVDVVAEPSDVEATVVISGDSALVSGPNTLEVVVTADDGTTSQTYSVTLDVAENNDATLGVFAVNGNDVTDGASVDLAYGTTEVDVVAEPTDVEATVVISGENGLVSGPNTLQVVVTAADGTSTRTYTVTLNVAENDDASLGVFAVNGNDVTNGATVNLDFGTTEVDVVAEPTDVEATVVISGDTALSTGTNTLQVIVTAADGVTTATYTVTLQVAQNSDSSLGVFAIDGTDVTDGGSVTVANEVTSVTIVAEATDPAANVQITGGTSLTVGDNTVTVVVTAANGVATTTYTVTVVRSAPAFSNDTSLSTFKIDGQTVADGGSLTIAQGRTSVSVEAVPTSNLATALTAGNTNLQPGPNSVTVTVTADDGTVKVYTVTVTVRVPSSDTSLASVKIDGNNFSISEDGTSVYNADFGTTAVTFAVVTNSDTATYTITGGTSLTVGNNNVSLKVTAETGVEKTYSFKIAVAAANTNTGLASLKVNNIGFNPGETIELPFGTADVTVDVETSAPTSTFTVSGASSIPAGESPLTVTITAQSGATETFTVTLKVLPASSVKTITGITVNGETVTGNAITLSAGTTEAEVVVSLANAFASYTVSGTNTVATGVNTRTITVTAQDGSTEQTVLTITVPEASTDNSLKSITVDGSSVAVDGTVEKANDVTSVNVVAEANSDKATVTVSGQDVLVPGLNTVTVTITAESGAQATYTFKVNVAKSTNTNVSSILVENTEVSVTKALTVGFGATEVEVSAVTSDANATYAVSGNTSLVSGPNNVTVTVTAADGLTTKQYLIVVTVPSADTDNSLKSITVDEAPVTAGSTIEKAIGTTSVSVEAEANSAKATVAVSGQDVLVPGLNTVTVTITAESGAQATYTFTVNVAKSNNVGLSSVLVENQEVKSTYSFTATLGATEVAVSAVTSDPDASYTVAGNTNLVGGLNYVVITVTAADGSTAEYTVVVTVPTLSSATNLRSITINGTEVNPGGGSLPGALPYGTASVTVVATPDSDKATVVVIGQDSLVPGSNTITATVTAESGATATYEYSVYVSLSTNTDVTSILVENTEVSVTKALTVGFGATEVEVSAVTADPDASYTVSGNTGLVSGPNNVTVTVTADDGVTTKQYVIVVTVPVADSDNSLKSITVDGSPVAVDGTVEKANDVTLVTVVAEANSDKATVAVSGQDALVPGLNTVTVTITAESGAQATYTFKVNVALSSNNALDSILVNGKSVAENETLIVSGSTTSVTVVALAVDADATVTVTGADALTAGDNTITVLITAANGDQATYTFVVRVPTASTNANLSVFNVNGVDALTNSLIEVVADVDEAVIIAQTEEGNASYAVTSSTALTVGDNTITVLVTAQDGTTTLEYSVTVKRAAPLSGDKTLATITVDGNAVSVGETYDVDFGTQSVTVVATPNDENATTLVTGATGLKTGNNTVSILVTAENGDTETYTFTVRVAQSNDNSLVGITVNGTVVELDALEFTVSSGTTSVAVAATPNDVDATYSVDGQDELDYGANNVTITVTAANGSTRDYVVVVTRTPLSGNNNIGQITVNGNTVAVDGTFEVDFGTTSVEVLATAEDTDATVAISASDALVTGNNVITITVTAANGTEATYEVNVFVKSLSNDTSLKLFTVNGENVQEGAEITLDGTNNFVSVAAQATDPNAQVTIEGTTDLTYGPNDVIVTVTAEDGTVATYTIVVIYPDITDTSLKTFTVNGVTVDDGDRVDVAYEVEDVEVVVETTDPDATFEVSGAEGLVSGENELLVTVTAKDTETIQEYLVIVFRAFNSDSSLASFQINGEDVVDGAEITLPAYTTEVEVTAEATDPEATVEISGATELSVGENLLTVTVTAADGVSGTDYVVTLIVPLGNNVEIGTFSVAGNDVVDGDVLDLEPYTFNPEIIIETVDPDATFVVTGGTDLTVGENTLTVTVTAADGETSVEYTVTLKLLAGNNVELATFTVNGEVVEDGGSVSVEYGTSEVEVVAEPTDADATVEIVGGVDLQPGENTVTVTVTAADGETTATYTVTVVVALNSDASLAVFAVNGVDVVDGDSVDLEYGVTSVEVIAEPTDPDATFEVEGASELISGENTLTVTVTAADGETTATYTVTLNVAFNSDATLGVFQVNGEDVLDGATVELPAYTTEVEVTAEATDPDATVEVEGGSELVSGENTLNVTVTAADGETTETYTVTLMVALGNDVTLSVFQVNGEDVEDGGSLDIAPLTTSVEVTVETTDPNASYEVSGNTELQTGSNTLTVVVTAEDGVTTATYTVTLNIPLNDDASLATFTVNGEVVEDGGSVSVEYGTSEVEVVAEPTDADATVEIVGGVDLQPGENTVTVTVTAADGETTATYTVTVTVALNDDASLAVFAVNGQDVVSGDSISLAYGVTSVEVIAEATDPDATVEISGNSELVSGENTLTVTVTAADGETSVEYTVTLNVAFNSDATLGVFQVNGATVTDGGTVELPAYTTDVEVTAEPTDPDATVEIEGASELSSGDNILTVTVTAADGATKQVYEVTLLVALGNDVTLSSFQINGEDVEDGGSVSVSASITEVEVSVETTDPDATFEVTGGDNLVIGNNLVTVVVTAADGSTTATYTATVVVISNDTSLATFTIDGVDVESGEVIELDYGVAEVAVVALATHPDATVEIEGGTELVSGENTVTVTVTAADGETTATYTVTLKVAFNSDASLAVFQINGVDVQDRDVVNLPAYTTDVEITAEATDPDATVVVEGGSELLSGENTVTVTVTAADQVTEQTYTVTLLVAPGNDVTVVSIQVNGEDVEDGGTIQVSATTTSVEVTAETTDPNASYEVIGGDALEEGANLVSVIVTAEDAVTTATYTFTVFVPSNDTSLAEFTVNGSPVDSGDYFELPLGTTDVEVVVVTTDEGATFEIDGGADLQPGENTLTVTVTAADGETTAEYVVTLFVLLSDDTSLSTFKVNGVDVEDGSDVELPPYTTDVEVEAVANNEDAQVDVSGADSLQPGANELVVTVTAADGETVQVYIVSIYVAISTEVGVTEILVNGVSALDGDVVLSTDLELTEVDVEVTAVDENATVEVTGNTELVKGDNVITITVTAQSGDVGEYTVIFRLGGLEGNAKLKSLIVAGQTINLTATDPSVTVVAGTRTVAVLPSAEDDSASIKVTGNTNLVAGDNTVTVNVKAADGKTTRTYTVKVVVLQLSNNKNLSSLKVNGSTVLPGATVYLVPGAKSAEVLAVAEDSTATITYTGNKNLSPGNNTATVTVRAANATTENYTITLVVPALSNVVTLKSFTIEGFNVLGKSKLSVPAGTTKLRVSAQATFDGASVEITGRDIKPGVNFVVVKVTAADGTTATYTVRVKA